MSSAVFGAAGGTMAAIDTLINLGEMRRNIYLYDTFDGMSEPTIYDKEFSGTAASALLNGSDKEGG